MGSHWFKGGLDSVHTDAGQWTSSATLRCSAVQGTSILTPDLTGTNLQDFLNDGNTLVGAEALLTGKSVSWDGSGYDFLFTDQVNFGAITNGTDLAGVVYYDGTSGDPSNAQLWACQESSATAAGGDVLWGASGSNLALVLDCLNISSRYSFRGTLSAIESLAAYWGDGTQRIGMALVEDANLVVPTFGWSWVQNLIDAGVVFCSGAAPGETQPYLNSTDRLTPNIDILGTAGDYEFTVRGTGDVPARTVLEWDIADLTIGETITAVIQYQYVSPFAAGSARILGWDDVTNYTIAAGTNVRYIVDASTILHRIQMP